MVSDFEWYQIFVLYSMGIVMFYMFRLTYVNLNKIFGIHHYTLTVIYLISGIIGFVLFTEPSPITEIEELNLWYKLWELLITSPIDLGIAIIMILILYAFLAIPVFIVIILILTIVKYWVNPDIFN